MQENTYVLAFRRSTTLRDIFGHTFLLSNAEIFPNVEVRRSIPPTAEAPAFFELALPLEGEIRLIIIPQSLVELRERDIAEALLSYD